MNWQESESIVPAVKAVKKLEAPGGTQKQVSFYPQVPKKLPDLKEGYLFNEERVLVFEKKKKVEEKPKDEKGPSIDMDKLFYAGSIIIGDDRKALVSYIEIQPKAVAKNKKAKRSKISERFSKQKYARLKINDQLGGYTVTEVEADHITFERGGKSIEKRLHDSSKVRIKPPARRKVVSSKKRSVSSSKKKVSLGTSSIKKKTVTSKRVRKSKVVQSKRVRTPAGTATRNIQPPVSR